VYIYAYVYIVTTRVYKCTFVSTHVDTCVYRCIFVSMHMQVDTYMIVCVFVHTPTYIYIVFVYIYRHQILPSERLMKFFFVSSSIL
jgi:hypothetical protein